MNNKKLLIGGGIVAVLIVGFLLIRLVGGSGTVANEEPTPTPTPAYQEVDESVTAELEIQPNGRFVDMTISGLDGRFESIEYELSYDTDKGPKGSIGKVNLQTGQDTVEREIELGTCSTGGTCTYHTGVHDFKLVVRFHTEDGEIFILREEFDEL